MYVFLCFRAQWLYFTLIKSKKLFSYKEERIFRQLTRYAVHSQKPLPVPSPLPSPTHCYCCSICSFIRSLPRTSGSSLASRQFLPEGLIILK